MIDINLVRENPEIVKKSNKKRGFPEETIDEMASADRKWRELKEEGDRLRSRRNKLSEEINQAKKQKDEKKAQALIKEAGEIPKKIAEKENLANNLKEKRDRLLKDNPNLIDKSVPVGDAGKNKVLKIYRKAKKGKEGHAEIMETLGLIDTKKAGEVAGARFYYLKKELVKLNHALMDFAMDFLAKKGFVLMQPPYMLRKDILDTALTLDAFEDAIYKIEGEDLYLIGTAEHSLNAYHNNEMINVDKPVRYAGISPCFRKEAGSHGKDTKGIFRVHQFEKIEQFIFCSPKDSWREFDFILNNSIEMFRLLGIPFRVVLLASGDTGRVPCKTIDLEGWFPSQNAYRELGSCSNCLDYQARRGNIKFSEKGVLKFVHTLNNTAIATERMLCCLVENNIRKGVIKIPKALWKYTGFKEIKATK